MALGKRLSGRKYRLSNDEPMIFRQQVPQGNPPEWKVGSYEMESSSFAPLELTVAPSWFRMPADPKTKSNPDETDEA